MECMMVVTDANTRETSHKRCCLCCWTHFFFFFFSFSVLTLNGFFMTGHKTMVEGHTVGGRVWFCLCKITTTTTTY